MTTRRQLSDMPLQIQSAIKRLRNISGWWEGDENAEKVLNTLLDDVNAGLDAALNLSEHPGKDRETVARGQYHELQDVKREATELRVTITSCEEEVSKVYCELTNNRFSKMNTRAEHVLAAVEEIQEGVWKEYLQRAEYAEEMLTVGGEEMNKLRADLISANFACEGFKQAAEGLRDRVFELTNTRAAMFEAMRLLSVDLAEMTKSRNSALSSAGEGEKLP